MDSPTKEEIIELREHYQHAAGLKTKKEAQTECAERIHCAWRTWLQWERGEAKMHPAFWELALIKLSPIITIPKPDKPKSVYKN
ncbi:MAG: hypothetical protein CMI01_15550 [Oceanospirillaceae bacterium]|nr:hypothetical protein [Oceanospirillaceae bacterium]